MGLIALIAFNKPYNSKKFDAIITSGFRAKWGQISNFGAP
jgi:hypothetical protein